MNKLERQRIDYSIPKCSCGNNLSRSRIEQGFLLCPTCEKPTLEERVEALERQVEMLLNKEEV